MICHATTYKTEMLCAALWRPPNANPDVDVLIELLQSSGSDEATEDGLVAKVLQL